LFAAAVTILRRPTARSAWVGDVIIPAVVVLLMFVIGMKVVNTQVEHPSTLDPFRPPLRVTFIQPSIPQTLIWDETKSDERFSELLRLSVEALTNKTDLVVWPEAAVPNLFRYSKEMFVPITELARSNHVWMIIGADDMEPKPGSNRREDAEFFNSSFLISPEGLLRETYKKRGLVIFGEYVPLVRWLPFMKLFTPVQGGFTPGMKPVAFSLGDLNVKTSVLICFEDIFPHLAREYVDEDTDFLVNITNNGWFGESAAQWQHGVSAIYRAIENGVPLLRCSNNGLTCRVDRFGRIQEIFRDSNGTIYGPGFLRTTIPLRATQKQQRTFYNRYGDVFGWTCVGWSLLLLARRILAMRSRQ
jgi:apolipoprotein N-acyltransferase